MLLQFKSICCWRDLVENTNNSEEKTSRIWELVSEIENFLSKPAKTGEENIELHGISGDEVVLAVANVLSLPLSQAARMLLISSLLRRSGRDLHCRFNELASLSGLSERTAYRALKEIKQSGLFEIKATPGIGVRISADWLWDCLGEGARRILEKENNDGRRFHNINIASPNE